jgi:septum site-determining protein MinC
MVVTELEAQKKCISLKGSLFPLSVLEFADKNLEDFEQDLKDLVKQAPNFFQNTPIVLDVHKTSSLSLPLAEIRKIMKANKLLLVGLRGASDELKKQAHELDIAALNKSRSNEPTLATRQVKTETVIQQAESTIIDKPVRSGQQIYARDGDLIVLSSVSEGAEILADGNIHIYGSLRGRALAGIQGNKAARIFVNQAEAELMSIAGIFTTKEAQLKISQRSQVKLVDDKLVFSSV